MAMMMPKESKYASNLNGEKTNHLIFMDDVKLFAISERGLESLICTVRVVNTDNYLNAVWDKQMRNVGHVERKVRKDRWNKNAG